MVTVVKFSETVDDGSVGMFLVLVLLEALLIAVEASVLIKEPNRFPHQ